MKAFALMTAVTAGPALAAHDGIIATRSGPEPSDIALFVMAAAGVWFVRRAMRSRFRRD